MQITYKAVALNLAEYAANPPRKGEMPVLKDGNADIYTNDGWVVIGHATVTVDYLQRDEVEAQQLDALKAKLQNVRAENQKRENAILDQISKLQAIGYEVEA